MCFVIFLILPSLGRLEALLEVLVPAFVPLICTDGSFQTVPDVTDPLSPRIRNRIAPTEIITWCASSSSFTACPCLSRSC